MRTNLLQDNLTGMTFIDSMNEFFEYLLSMQRSKETIKVYRLALTKCYRYLCSKKNREIYIDELTSDDIEKYMSDDNANLTVPMKHHLIVSIKSFTGYCFNKGLCRNNIGKEIGYVKCRVREETSLTEEEFQDLVDNIPDPIIKCVVYTMFYTGCRINELVRLTTEDVDLIRNTITLRSPKGYRHKDRVIPICRKLKNILIEYLSIRLGGDTEDSFFVLKRSGGISDLTVNRAINEAIKKAGIDRQITNHTLRHTFASLLAQEGVDLKRIQLLLGHSRLEITNIYLHANPKDLRDAVNLLK